MEHPFSKSVTNKERAKRLLQTVQGEDVLGIMIDADPDAMASALALKRIFWRRVRKVSIYHINEIERTDNLAMIALLKIDQKLLSESDTGLVTKWAVVDSQPMHHEAFGGRDYSIIIDHHPVDPGSKAGFMDIRERYGATSTILTEYLRALRIRPSARLATALFYGIKTDTDNFVRDSLPADINAFRYLYRFANMNIIKKIESSEINTKSLAYYRTAIEQYRLINDLAYVYMGEVGNPDSLVMVADFFMRLAEVSRSVAAGVYRQTLVIVVRNAGFRRDAARLARRLLGDLTGSAGGHRAAARAEIELNAISGSGGRARDPGKFVFQRLRRMLQARSS